MNDIKHPLASATVWAGVITVLASLVAVLGYTIGPEDQAALADGAAQLVGLATSLITVISGAVAIWGRVTATKRVG
jgi:hypothetical protein